MPKNTTKKANTNIVTKLEKAAEAYNKFEILTRKTWSWLTPIVEAIKSVLSLLSDKQLPVIGVVASLAVFIPSFAALLIVAPQITSILTIITIASTAIALAFIAVSLVFAIMDLIKNGYELYDLNKENEEKFAKGEITKNAYNANKKQYRLDLITKIGLLAPITIAEIFFVSSPSSVLSIISQLVSLGAMSLPTIATTAIGIASPILQIISGALGLVYVAIDVAQKTFSPKWREKFNDAKKKGELNKFILKEFGKDALLTVGAIITIGLGSIGLALCFIAPGTLPIFFIVATVISILGAITIAPIGLALTCISVGEIKKKEQSQKEENSVDSTNTQQLSNDLELKDVKSIKHKESHGFEFKEVKDTESNNEKKDKDVELHEVVISPNYSNDVDTSHSINREEDDELQDIANSL